MDEQRLPLVDEGWAADQGRKALERWLDADPTGFRRHAMAAIESAQDAEPAAAPEEAR